MTSPARIYRIPTDKPDAPALENVIAMLEEVLGELRAGEISPNIALLVLVTESPGEWDHSARYAGVGRNSDIIGLLEVTKAKQLRVMMDDDAP